jgi:ribonucleoside-diphosphate reductase alpha chain
MGCGTLFVTVNRDEKGLCEVFANLGKAGGCPSQTEATCRAVSVALRSRVSPEVLIEQLRGIRCLSTATARQKHNGVDVLSCPDAIARALEETLSGRSKPTSTARRNVCPDCGARLRKEEGCLVCTCGYSKCS